MKKMSSKKPAVAEAPVSEMLILMDGRILAHNISPVLAGMLSEMDPADEPMRRRANQKTILKHEIPG